MITRRWREPYIRLGLACFRRRFSLFGFHFYTRFI